MTSERKLSYSVTGMSCGHCEQAVADEVGSIVGVRGVDVDLPTGTVTVDGEDLDDAVVRAAIHQAGFETAAW